MRRFPAGSVAAAMAATALLAATAPASARSPGTGPVWTSCGSKTYPNLECATVTAPLDYADPHGRQITLAVSRVKHTSSRYQGVLLVNPGGPGGSGVSLAGYVASKLPGDVAAQYDVIGFDPRGVGRSSPALDCVPGYFTPVRPDSVPRSPADELADIRRAQSFAAACGKKYAAILPYMDTADMARDMDTIRAALGQHQISYLGYSYGTYLGAVYAQLFPGHVRRLVLDSIVDPAGVWYEDNLSQDYAFDKRMKAFAAWVAKYDAVYHLGTDPAAVEQEWYAMRSALRTKPAGGRVGPSELEDTFTPGGYNNRYWPALASAFSAYVRSGKEQSLVSVYDALGAVDASGDNEYSVYTAVECNDARWPRDWATWHADTTKVYRTAPFLAWNNTWYNAPCAFWPVQGGRPVQITGRGLPPVLLFQATDDAATPFEGGLTMHRLLTSSRLVVEVGDGNHGITLFGNSCPDHYLSAYLRDGTVPPADSHGLADATCPKTPDPVPPAPSRQSQTAQSQTAQSQTAQSQTAQSQTARLATAALHLARH